MAYNILVVDDSSVVRSVIGKTIELAQVDVGEILYAANGKEALEQLKNKWVDIVFADINMPVMNGLEMIEQMEKDGLMETVPVIIVSTEGSTTRIEQLKQKGIKGYIRKPFTPEKIKEVFTKTLGDLKNED